MTTNEFINWCVNQHDVECNQKYNNTLPYSFHLDCVHAQVKKFRYVLDGITDWEWYNVRAGAYGHDLYEDARCTFNQVKDLIGEDVAEIIYLCTENRGRTRAQRKNDQFYTELKDNRLAVYVKLCDIIANVKFSLLTESTMFGKYRDEYPKVKHHLYRDEYKPMFDYLELLFTVK